MFTRLPKEDVARGGGSIRDWGFAIADVYSTETNIRDRRGCEGSGSVIFRFRGAGATGEAG